MAYRPDDPLTLNVSGPGTTIGSTQQRTNIDKDPWQDFLYKTILGQTAGSKDAFVPDYTKAALEQFTKNPAMAAEYFPQLAEPLLASLRPQEQREATQLTDMFRKAGIGGGSLQQGSYAQAGRQLIGDQASRQQQLLAQNYVPLTGQLSTNMTNAIRSGLDFPQANLAAARTLVPLATSLKPLQTDTETLQGSTGSLPPVPAAPSWLSQPYVFPAGQESW